jgi:acyl carrier protein
VHIPFSATERNAPALEFHRTLPSPATAAALAAIEFVPRREATPAPAAQPAAKAAAHSVDYAHIAAHLSSVAAIRRHMRRHKAVQLETPTETRLAAIWQDLLDAETVTGASNFFDLGGHSLKVVLLLMRVNDEFGVELGIEDVYGAEVTLERMARRIDELAAFGGVGHDDYQRLLAEIESMTDDEALSALLEESGRHADSARR